MSLFSTFYTELRAHIKASNSDLTAIYEEGYVDFLTWDDMVPPFGVMIANRWNPASQGNRKQFSAPIEVHLVDKVSGTFAALFTRAENLIERVSSVGFTLATYRDIATLDASAETPINSILIANRARHRAVTVGFEITLGYK